MLLEPGPSYPLFQEHPDRKKKEEARCEWDLMQVMRRTLGKGRACEVLKQHRDTHITKKDFEEIRRRGLNAVRLPFGYWIVLGPDAGEPYFGPALEYIDQAVSWAEECGLQIVLDLHGCPGGESGEAPCGRRQRPDGKWQWKQWRRRQSLEALELLAKRYSSRQCVTGIEVCNEPSNTIPEPVLIRYYDQAVEKVRKAGMPASRVAVVLPVFQRCEEDFARKWHAAIGDKHSNICFDVHCYHCFENNFNGKTLAEHCRAVEENAAMLRKFPMVVGEWSLALGQATWSTCGRMAEHEVYKLFGSLQVEAFKAASHGRFFWNWTEKDDREWNFQQAYAEGLLVGGMPLARALPSRDGQGEDPLEERLHPSPPEPRVLLGDTVYFRVFYGRYVDIEGTRVRARWPDKGTWQEFTFCSAAPTQQLTGKTPSVEPKEVRDGDLVRLRSHSGRFLAATPSGVTAVLPPRSARAGASRRDATAGPVPKSTVFEVALARGAKVLRHRGIAYFRSLATGCLLDADTEEEGLYTRFDDPGWWQSFAVEKVTEEAVPATPTGKATCQTPAKGAKSVKKQTSPKKPKVKRQGLASPTRVGSAAAAKQHSATPAQKAVRGGAAAATPRGKRHRAAGAPWESHDATASPPAAKRAR